MNETEFFFLERSFYKMNVPFSIKIAVTDRDAVVERILNTSSQMIVDDLDVIDDKFSPQKADSLISKFHRGEAEVFFQDDMFQVVYNQAALAKIATKGQFDAFANDRFDPSEMLTGWAIEVEFMKHLKPLLVDPHIVGVSLSSSSMMQVAADPKSFFAWDVVINDPDDAEKIAHYQIKNGAVATSTYNDGKSTSRPQLATPKLITLVSKGVTEAAILAQTAIEMDIDSVVDLIETSQLTGLILPADSTATAFFKGRFNDRKLYALKNNQSKLSQL